MEGKGPYTGPNDPHAVPTWTSCGPFFAGMRVPNFQDDERDEHCDCPVVILPDECCGRANIPAIRPSL